MLGRNLLSRGILLRTIKNVANNLNQVRNGSHGVWSYRVPPPMPCKRTIYQAEILGGLCWWWILYHCATEPEHIYVGLTFLLSELDDARNFVCITMLAFSWYHPASVFRLITVTLQNHSMQTADASINQMYEEHLGEWPYVDPSTWTDEELGIPPDSVGSLKK